MKNIIKTRLILLFLSLIPWTPVKSQIILDSIQTKILNIILAEHEKLIIENPLLKQQIESLEELNKINEATDSIQKIEIKELKDRVKSDKNKINKLEKSKKKLIVGSSIGGIILFILGLII